MATAQEFVELCLEEAGDNYVYGAEVEPGTPSSETTEWDCSELVHVKLNELGIDAPDGSTAQLQWCEDNGTLIPLEDGINTLGALLLREGHVAVSLGNGKTIEAMGSDYGVGSFSATEGRTFTHAGLVPGLDYDGGAEDPLEEMEPVEDEGMSYVPEPEFFEPDTQEGAKDSGNGRAHRPRDRKPRLRRGVSGGAVRFLQKKLKRLNHYSGMIDGKFGPLTEHAVSTFQKNMRIDQDGVVGGQTWGAMGKFRRRVKKQKVLAGR